MGLAAILELALPVIPELIGIAERLISKPKTGDTKMSVVMQSVRAFISGITATTMQTLVPGEPPESQPTDDELRAFIQTKFTVMKNSGTLTATAAPNGQLYLVQGPVMALNMVKLA